MKYYCGRAYGHWVQIEEGMLRFGHLKSCDAQRPDVRLHHHQPATTTYSKERSKKKKKKKI